MLLDAELAVRVTFGEPGTVLDNEEVLPLLRRVRDDARRVIGRFEEFFTG
jgi:hypothetical protein